MSGLFSRLKAAFNKRAQNQSAPPQPPSEPPQSPQTSDLMSSTALSTPRASFRTVWDRLLKPFWMSEEKWKARGLLGGVLGLTLAQVYVNVLVNKWNVAFYNAIQNIDAAEFTKQIGVFSGLAAVYIGIVVYRQYLAQSLQMRWRDWMTKKQLSNWFNNKAHYRLQSIYARADNPDQRISDDVNGFTNKSLSLGIGAINSALTLASFTHILWALSGQMSIAGYNIPGYMVWVALGYSAVGTWITNRIGKKLVSYNYEQEKLEADFRYSLVRVRENSESIAFYDGEKAEKKDLTKRFNRVVGNWWQLIRKEKHLGFFTAGYGQAAIIFPFIAAAPRYFSKGINMGELMQTASAFGKVQESLSWFIDVYPQYASWQSATNRLVEFNDAIDRSNTESAGQNLAAAPEKKDIAALPAPQPPV